ncbi:short chain dehydrogenase/reductase [Apiospora arundinis]
MRNTESAANIETVFLNTGGFVAWCAFFIVKIVTSGEQRFTAKVQCKQLLDNDLEQYDTAEQVQLVERVAGLIELDPVLKNRIDQLYKKRIEGEISQPASKRPRLAEDASPASIPNSGTTLSNDSLQLTTHPATQLVLDQFGNIPGFEQATGVFSLAEGKRLFVDTNVIDAIVRLPTDYVPGIRMYFARPGVREIGCCMEIEIDDEKSPDIIKDLFGVSLKIDHQGRYLYLPASGSILRLGSNTILERCKRAAVQPVLGLPIWRAVIATTLFQQEGKECREYTRSIWAVASAQLESKIKLRLLLGVFEGNGIWQKLFREKERIV